MVPGGAPAAVVRPPPASSFGGKPGSPDAAAVLARRRVAIKKAFKRLDPLGTGVAIWEDMRHALAQGSQEQQRLADELQQLTERHPDGRLVLSFASFLSYYVAVSQSIAFDGDFEQLLHSQWGYADVSDILKSMQKQFARVGLKHVFQDCPAGEVSLVQFEGALRRGGMPPRKDDMQRLGRSFVGPKGGLMLDQFMDQILAPRPETPPPVSTRDLAVPSSPSAAATAVLPLVAPSSAWTSPHAAPRPQQGPPATDGDLDDMLSKMEGHLHHLRKKQAAGQAAPQDVVLPGIVPSVPVGGGASAGIIPGSPPFGGGAGIVPGPSPMSGGAQAGPTAGLVPMSPPKGGSAAAPHHMKLHHHEVPDGPVSQEDLDSMLSKMEGHLNHLRAKKAAAGGGVGSPAAGGGSNLPDGPVSDADLDAALAHMEGHISKIKQHKHDPNAQPHWDNSAPVEDPPDMPHWEHHKYDHHEITAPAWKPQATISDISGHQHQASEYGYSNYGAGSHGHHLSHFHLNDYHGLAHHSFKQEEYGKQQYGDAAHHGHWVPHLHGIGTSAHHGEHSYGKEEYHNQSYGAAGHHGHWVPHLHGLGEHK